MKHHYDHTNPREVRQRLGLSQQQFWGEIGVTQSGGSRYEGGRSIPKPVLELLRLVHIEGIDISKIKREDFEVIEYLKLTQPAKYRDLKKLAKLYIRGR